MNESGARASRRVLMLVDDLFFATRIATAARHLGIEVLRDLAAGGAAPDLVVIDLHSRRDPLAAIASLKAAPATREVPIVAFLSHVETGLRDRARAAGADIVLPRSAFTAKLAEILAGKP
jgi:CheY-like chemotaxis protein